MDRAPVMQDTHNTSKLRDRLLYCHDRLYILRIAIGSASSYRRGRLVVGGVPVRGGYG